MAVRKVPPGSGGSREKRVLHLYSNATLGQVGKKIAELATYYPKIGGLYITSGYRSQGSDHHGGLSYKGSPTAAVDFGAYDRAGRDKGQRRMRDFAKWLEDVAPGYKRIVELIHTTPYSTDDGFYVDNGLKLGPGGFGPAVNRAHLNHVHLAMSNKQVTAALKRMKKSELAGAVHVKEAEDASMTEAV